MKNLISILALVLLFAGCSITDSNNITVDKAVVSAQGAESFNVRYTSSDGVTEQVIEGDSAILQIASEGFVIVTAEDAKVTAVLFGNNEEVDRMWSTGSLRLNY